MEGIAMTKNSTCIFTHNNCIMPSRRGCIGGTLLLSDRNRNPLMLGGDINSVVSGLGSNHIVGIVTHGGGISRAGGHAPHNRNHLDILGSIDFTSKKGGKVQKKENDDELISFIH